MRGACHPHICRVDLSRSHSVTCTLESDPSQDLPWSIQSQPGSTCLEASNAHTCSWPYSRSLLSSKTHQGAPTGCLMLESRLREDVQLHVCGWFLLGSWIQVETEQTRADPKMDGFLGNMLWNMSMKSRPRMSGQYASHMPHPALHALPWLGFGLECGSVWGVSLGEPIQVWWTSMWGQAFLVNQACLVAVGWGSTYSGLWVSRTCLVFGRWKIWPDPASEVARTACLDPPRLPGLTSCPVGLDPRPGVTPPQVPSRLVECASRPDQESQR